MLSYVVPVVLKKPIVVLKDNRDPSTKGRLQKQEQRTTMPCGCISESYQLIFCILLTHEF